MGTSFGRYKVAEELGRGAMGVVYRAVDPAIGRSVAIKAINHAYLESLGVRPVEYAERFQREAQVAGALNHPHIVKIFDLGPDYLVMEFVEGQTLAAVLRAQGRLPHGAALRILGQAAAALDHAHANGIVHRDIKPANIMVQFDGVVKVMDFGLARIESSTLTAAGEVLGSAAYMAPEVVLGHPADARSDNFSLAVVAYELITGLRPFAGPTVSAIIQSVVRTTPRRVTELDATLPPEVDAVFTRALAKEPGERYALAGELVRTLAAAPWATAPAAVAPLTVGADPDSGQATVILATASTLMQADDVPAPDETSAILTVDADELGEPSAPDAGAETLVEGQSPDRTSEPVEAVAETVALKPQPVAPPPAAPEVAAATVILKAPVAPPVPAGPPVNEVEAATVVLRAADVAPPAPPAETVMLKPATPQAPPPATPVAAASDASAATIILKAPTLKAPTPQAPVPPPALSAPASVPPAPPAPIAAPLPAAAPRTPAPPAAKPAPAPQPSPAAKAPVGRKPTPVGWVVGVVALILLLFGGAVAGFFWLVRSRNAQEAVVAPPPAETTPAPPEPAPPATTAAETTPAEEPAPEPTPAEVAPTPAAPQAATLVIASEPAGATVSIGRRRRGRTPLRLSVPPGSAVVSIEKDGFKPWRENARLKPGETRQLQARLEPLEPPRSASTPAPPPPARAAVREGDLVPLGPDVTAPRKLAGDSPKIPDKLRRKLSGSAVVEFVVGIDGRVSGARIVESFNLAVDQAVLDAVATWRYEPARSHGVRVRVTQRARFTFVAN